jgi:hypothetical protein
MPSSKLIKWSLAASAAAMLSIAVVPAMAAHVTHKRLAATTKKPLHSLVAAATTTTGKAHRLTAHSRKLKTLAASRLKRLSRLHHRPTLSTAARHHAAKTLDKIKKPVSNM